VSGWAAMGHRQVGPGSAMPEGVVKPGFELKSEFKRGQTVSNLAQISIASNRTFPDFKILK
jgi:hypothetical protein